MRTLLRLMLCGGLFALGCGDDDDAPRGRGSAACQDFQDSACDFIVDQCGGTSRAACDKGFRGIECKSDDAASACANGLNDATCGQAVSGCDLGAVIDPAPAIARCQTLVDKVCDHLVGCKLLTSRDACQVATMMGLSCAQAVSTSLDFEDCVQQVDGLTCENGSLPTVCQGAIGALPTGVL
jgi:hypothetical protein